MFDIHSHLLPGIDDGPEGWSTSIEMARIALANLRTFGHLDEALLLDAA